MCLKLIYIIKLIVRSETTNQFLNIKSTKCDNQAKWEMDLSRSHRFVDIGSFQRLNANEKLLMIWFKIDVVVSKLILSNETKTQF